MYDNSKKNAKFAASLLPAWVAEACRTMLLNPIDTFLIILKGLVVGIIVSAPMGPVGVLTVRRTLNKGRWFGLVTGLGAVVSDMIYALLTALCMSMVMEFYENSPSVRYFKWLAVTMLFLFGLYSFCVTPQPLRYPSRGRGTLAQNMLTGFLVAVTNPLIVVLFIALFDSFNFIKPEYHYEYIFGFAAIAVGACLWWFSLTKGIDRVRARFEMKNILRLNRAIGIVVMLAALVGLLHTLSII